MSRDQWEQALARAVVEAAFRARLLADPADALADYGLRDDQRRVVDSVHSTSLIELAHCVLRAGKHIWGNNLDGLAIASDWL
jgi:hypothetical protein